VSQARVEAWSDDGRTVITVRGEVDLANHKEVETEIREAISNRTTLVEIDLTHVAFIDSAGLRTLFTLASRLDRLQIRLALIAPEASPARRVVELSGLSSLVPVRNERAGPD
jgi:anti-anti-sigma factor